MAKKLTDVLIKKIPVPKDGPRVVWDSLQTGLGVKVTPKGKRLFVFQTIYPGYRFPATRTLGAYPGLSLAEARARAASWYSLAKADIDPSREEEKKAEAARRAAALAERNSFLNVSEAYIARALPGQRWAHRVEHQIRKELIPVWGSRPISEIDRHDVIELIDKIVARPAHAYAYNVFQIARNIFNFACERGLLEHAATDRIKPAKLIGARRIRTRTLTNDELRRLWAATEVVGYPFGSAVRLLLLTGVRPTEATAARWREFDLANRLWVIPAERYKSNAQHHVPLGDDLMALLESLPRWPHGDCVFTTTGGRKAINGASKMKRRLDAAMGDAPRWTLHDIRRTVRTRLSELRIDEAVSELVIGHAPRGLRRIYVQHEYATEIRESLAAWADHLRGIVGATPATPPAATVVALRGARR